MGCLTPVYRPRDAEHTVLHQVIAEHLEAFLGAVAAAGDGAGLPQFVEREFREFLLCGVYEAGVARFQCEGCACEHLVPFSCKGRGFCQIPYSVRRISSRRSRPMKKSATNGTPSSRVTRLRKAKPNALLGAKDEANFAAACCLRLRNGIRAS